jgi:hypothetical protein
MSSACTPAARPRPRARKTYTASRGSLSVLRKRTAATIPARLNARARLFLTTMTMPATTSGSTIIDWTNERSVRSPRV